MTVLIDTHGNYDAADAAEAVAADDGKNDDGICHDPITVPLVPLPPPVLSSPF